MEENMSKSWTKTIALVAMLCMVLSTTDVFAGPGASGSKKKVGFFAKIGKAIKKASHKAAVAVKKAATKTANAIKTGVKKVGMGIKTAGAKVVNGIMDTGVWAKQKLLNKKNKVWVCGHYDKNGKYIKGHWRKLNSGKPSAGGNTASQSAGGDDYSSDYPSNDDQGLSGDGNSYEENSAPAEEAPVAAEEAPVAGEDPVLPELPAEEPAEPAQNDSSSQESEQSNQSNQESEQCSQESSQTAQSGEEFSFDTEVSMRTMGMLMDDIIAQSKSINEFKKTAKSNISYSVEVSEDVNTTYESREDDAGLLSRVVVWDLQVNNGTAGKYYNFFLNRMKTLDPQSRALVKDVVIDIRSGIVHGSNNASTEEEKSAYAKRLAEIANY